MTTLPVGCTPSGPPDAESWDGTVQQWGTLRNVMHGKVVDGQVRVSEVTAQPHFYGIGVPDGLRGELLINDSVAWAAKIRDGNSIETRKSDSTTDSAALLAVAQVPRWTEVPVEQDVSAADFDDFVQKTLSHFGLDKLETVPFVIEGRFPTVQLHVLNGQCPFAEVKKAPEGTSPPHRMTLDDVQGLVVGFYAESGAGRITHHWTRTHVHVLAGPEGDRVTGHVDAVAVKAGSVFRVPVYDAGLQKRSATTPDQ